MPVRSPKARLASDFSSSALARLGFALLGRLSCFLFFIDTATAQDVQITGDVTPSPASSPIWNMPGQLIVGSTGNGTLTISNNGAVSDTSAVIANGAASVSSVSVSGGLWTNSSFIAVGNSGNGTLTVSGNGTVFSTTTALAVNPGSTGSLQLLGGTLTARQVSEGSGNGTVTFNDGTLRLTGDQTNLFAGFESGDVTLSGASTIDTQGFMVASSLGLTGGGELNKQGSGTLTLTGSNTYTGRTHVRDGTLVLGGTGEINSIFGSVNVGQSTGEVGTFILSDDAVVNVVRTRLGSSANSTGTAIVTGGIWSNSLHFAVGDFGSGTLHLSNGTIYNQIGFIGAVTGSTGTANVSGGSWLNAHDFAVGNGGNGTLNLSGDGLVSSRSVIVAGVAGITGNLNLNGGTLRTGQVGEGGGTGSVTFNGGTLRLSTNQANLFSGFEVGDVVLTNSGGTIDTQGFNVATALGLTGNGSLTKTGSGTLTLSASNTHTGGTTVRQGTLVLDGASASLGGSQLTVGRDSGDVAFLRNEGGATSSMVGGVVDIARDAGSQGTVTMTGGTLTTFDLFVGRSGNGTFTMTGGTVNSFRAWVGFEDGSQGLLQLGGNAVWNQSNVRPLVIGAGFGGRLEISGDAQLNLPISSLFLGGTTVDFFRIGAGTATMTGGSISALDINIGVRGTGEFFLSGGNVSARNTRVGQPFGTGTLTMTGGTLVNTSSIGGLFVEDGTFNLQGGTVVATNGIVGRGGATNIMAGVANVSGGTWSNTAEMRIGDEASGHGTLNLTGGSITNTIGNIGRSAGSTGIVNASGGAWNSSAELIVGNAGTGTLTLSGTSQITSAETIVGRLGSGVGTLNVDGGTLTTGPLSIGRAGAGTLTTGGNAIIHASEFVVGSLAGSTGHLQINSGSLYGGQFSRGAGIGTMTLNGGTILLTTHQTNLFAGFADGEVTIGGGTINDQGFNASTAVGLTGGGQLTKLGTGTLTLAGTNVLGGGFFIREGTVRITGSHTNNAIIFAGYNPFSGEHGFLDIAEGGSVTATQFTAGQFEDSTGTLRVTDGSLTTSAITLGNRGNGFLELGPGGSIITTGVVNIGSQRPSLTNTPYTGGNATISGGTWSISDALVVGRFGTGIMEISGSSSVTSASTLLGDAAVGIGTLNLLGGTLTTGQLSEGSGSGAVNFDGGTLRLSTNQSNLFSGFEAGDVVLTNSGGTIDTQGFNVATALGLTGNGSLTKTGTGTLALSGTNTYTGPTTIEQGTLALNGTLTASDLLIESGVKLIGSGVFGDVVLDPGAFVAPGNSIGTLSGTSLTWNAGATFVFDLGPGGVGDLIDISGDFTKGGSGIFDFSFIDEGWEVGETYTLIEFLSTSFLEEDFTYTNGGGFDGTFALNPNSLTFTVTAVPEPGTVALLAAAAGLLAWHRLRSRRHP